MKTRVLFFLWFISLLFKQNAWSETIDDEYLYLDNLALSAGADKASNYHNYTQIYARYFAHLKESPIKFLEIGIHKGNSVKLWEQYFQNAELHFMDTTLERVEYTPQRAHYHIADQQNPHSLLKLIEKTGGNFDVIIDDGGHTMIQQLVSFKYLFPQVTSGGFYIVEDLHTSYWESHGGGKHSRTMIAFLKHLIDEVNFVGARSSRASHLNIDPATAKELNEYRAQIESIHFYDSIAVILKR